MLNLMPLTLPSRTSFLRLSAISVNCQDTPDLFNRFHYSTDFHNILELMVQTPMSNVTRILEFDCFIKSTLNTSAARTSIPGYYFHSWKGIIPFQMLFLITENRFIITFCLANDLLFVCHKIDVIYTYAFNDSVAQNNWILCIESIVDLKSRLFQRRHDAINYFIRPVFSSPLAVWLIKAAFLEVCEMSSNEPVVLNLDAIFLMHTIKLVLQESCKKRPAKERKQTEREVAVKESEREAWRETDKQREGYVDGRRDKLTALRQL